MTPGEQAQLFLAMMLCGAGMGAAYDALWLLRRTLFRGKAACALIDLLFGLICAAGVVLSALCLRRDAFRWYTLLGAFAGMLLYAASLGMLMRKITVCVSGFVKKSPQKDGK